jgi:uncharacterized protein (DUF2384 family)
MAYTTIDAATPRIAEVIAHATVALDGQQNAMRWLQQQNADIAGRTPLEVLFVGTPEERQQVDDMLSAMEYGVFT